MYEYRAQVIRVVDGDTVHAAIDLGIDTRVNLTLRLNGINAPEKNTVEGIAASEWLEARLAQAPFGHDGPIVTIRTEKDRREKYGRYLATILIAGEDINAAMIREGMAVAYDGTGKVV
jgi:micrococcal nuclease